MQQLGIRNVLLGGYLLNHMVFRMRLLRLKLINKGLGLVFRRVLADITVQRLDPLWKL